MAEQKQDDQHEHTFSNYVRIRDVVQKTGQRGWTIGKVTREDQGYPCYQHDMMMRMMKSFIRLSMDIYPYIPFQRKVIVTLIEINLNQMLSSCWTDYKNGFGVK